MIETFMTIKCVPYSSCIYGLSKNSGEYYRDITEKEYEKKEKDSIGFERLHNINEMLD